MVQTALYADFFYYYFKSWRLNKKLQVPTMCALREEQLCELTDLSFAGALLWFQMRDRFSPAIL